MEVVPGGRVLGQFDLRLVRPDVVEAVPFPAHEAGAHVDLLDGGVDDRAFALPLLRAQVAADRVEGGDVGDVAGNDLEVVQVGRQAVAAAYPRHDLIAGVHHEVFALAEAERQHPALPPRQVALPVEGLLAEVLRHLPSGERFEPHQPAAGVVDQGPVLAGPGAVGREDVAGARGSWSGVVTVSTGGWAAGSV